LGGLVHFGRTFLSIFTAALSAVLAAGPPLPSPTTPMTSTIESMFAHDDAVEKSAAEEDKWKMPVDFFYSEDDPTLKAVSEEADLPSACTKPTRFHGFDFKRYYNLVWTSTTEFAYVTGHVIVIVNIETGDRRYMQGRDNGGIGGIAMNSDLKHIAVAEKSTTTPPNIYIYAYKDLKLYRVLRKGTERGYACVAFSPHNKSHLAALGKAPDYLLSIWDWQNERLLLKCKAFGQEIYMVRWGDWPGKLTTQGSGHIRFWQMASTFTGLKLQGDIGKFGATELSDIVGSCELPDGKVVSGTEYGRLLLWQGVFVKVELMRGSADDPRRISCLPHEGSVDVIRMDKEVNCVVSGGSDGYLRWWPVPEIDEAEADYDNGILEYGISVRKEIRIPADEREPPAHILHVASNHDGSTWLIQDLRNGVVWNYDRDAGEVVGVIRSHAGSITGALVSPPYPGLAITAGEDGTLRGFNMTSSKDAEVFADKTRGKAGIRCMAAAPDTVDPERRTILCGYEDGIVRAFSICRDGFIMIGAQKPHTCPVRNIAYSVDASYLATLGVDNTIFIFEVHGLDEHLVPLGFLQIPCQVNSMTWHISGRLLLGLQDGTIVELARPVPEAVDNTETFLIALEYKALAPELPIIEESESEAEDEDEEKEEEEEEKETKEERRERRRREKEEAKKAKEEEEDDEDGDGGGEIISAITNAVYMPVNGEEGEEAEDGDVENDVPGIVLFAGTGKYAGALWSMPVAGALLC